MIPTEHMTRREFVATVGGAAVGATVAPVISAAGANARSCPPSRSVVTQSSALVFGRSACGVDPSPSSTAMSSEFVGLCDINPLRVEVAKKQMGVSCPTFTDFDQMLNTAKPDLLMVTTVDGYHSEFIVRGARARHRRHDRKADGHRRKQCQAVLDAEKKSGRTIVVTFNYRYAPKHQKIKELLMSGVIGKVTSVDFHGISTSATAPTTSAAGTACDEERLAVGAQSHAPLRFAELVARRGSVEVRRSAICRTTAKTARSVTRLPRLSAPGQVPLLLGHHQGPA